MYSLYALAIVVKVACCLRLFGRVLKLNRVPSNVIVMYSLDPGQIYRGE